MLYSMTGYGEHRKEVGNVVLTIAIQSLNSRYLDVFFNGPKSLGKCEETWRKTLGKKLIRGRIEVTVHLELKEMSLPLYIAKENVEKCYHYLRGLSNNLGTQSDLLALTIKVLSHTAQEVFLDAKEVACLHAVFEKALDECLQARGREGAYLVEQITDCLVLYEDHLQQILTYVPMRKEQLRGQMAAKMSLREGGVDDARWEQEVRYYLEKMSIDEECVRLKSHIAYIQALLHKESPIGLRLLFIVQEMMRETNTLGAKSQDVTIQHAVVAMKDALEQIKEQARNLL